MRAFLVVVAVLAGYLNVAVLLFVGGLGLATLFDAGVGPPSPRHAVAAALFATVVSSVGGYVCARLAPSGLVLISVVLLFGLVLTIGAITGRAAATPAQPLWYQAVMTLLHASGVLIGAVIERSNAATRARRGRA